MTRQWSTRSFIVVAAVLAACPLVAQATANGSLAGIVRDPRGLVLPGATVSLSGPEIVGYRAATTDEDGSYRFPAVPVGTYVLTCKLLGFDTLRREGIVVGAGQALVLDLVLASAPLAPPAPPASGPPIVDAGIPGAATSFGSVQLDGVPTAANMWAVLDSSPGVQMRGYDVGGSHKALQTGYETFGIRGQNRIVNDGVNTTEGTGGSGGYYDYYSLDEVRVTARGADVEMSTPGAEVVATWKRGGDRFSGLVRGEFETPDLQSNNIDEDIEARGGTPAKIRDYYEYHANVGGPIVKDRAWFYGAYNRVFLDRAVSGQDPEIASEISDFDMFTGKLNFRLSSKDDLVVFGHWSYKQQPNRGLSLTVPPESVLFQESWTRVLKAEWQRTWSDRLTSRIMAGYFGYDWTLVPTVDPSARPPRIDTATGMQSGAGWAPFESSRWKPQSTGVLEWRLPAGRAGSHEIKLGWDWQIDRYEPGWSDASGAIRYLDNSAFGRPTSLPGVLVDRILLANVPNQGETDYNQHTDFFAQDAWRLDSRLTLTLGVRVGRQDVYYGDVESIPLQSDVFSPTIASGAAVIDRWNVAPRVGVAIDLMGDGRSVLKGYFGRFYANLGSGIGAANPGGRGIRVYEFQDLNGNGIYDGTQELGKLLDASGGGATRVDSSFALPYSDELSASLEQELFTDFGFRFAFVHKTYRNWWDSHVNMAQTSNLTNSVTAICAGCPLGLDGTTLNLLTVPDDQDPLVDPWIANAPFLPTTGGDNTDMSFTTWQIAVIRRFRDGFFFQGSFDKQFREELRTPEASTSPFVTDPLGQGWFQNQSLDVTNRQKTKYWTAKVLARYVAPGEFGFGLSLRYQSGFPWAPVYRLQVPNVGTKAVFLTTLDENRSEDVVVADLRVDKTWRFHDHYSVTAIADLYNLTNENPVTNFIVDAGSRFDNVIEWLPGRTLKLGLRFEF